MRSFCTLLLLISLNASMRSQYFYPEPKINATDPSLPAWVKEMYAQNPDVFKVDEGRNLYFANRGSQHDDYTRWYKRWRRYVAPYINEAGYIEMPSVEERLATSQSTQQRGGTQPWEFLGPKRHYNVKYSANDANVLISDHANVYCFDRCTSNPQIWYCGTECGGVYKSTDAAQTWNYVTRGLNVEDISAIAVDPANADHVLFSSAGEIWKSSDGGTSWNITGDASFQSLNIQVYQFQWHPQNSQLIFAGTNEGLFRSDDSGNTWSQLFSGECMSVEFKPNNAEVMYALRFNGSTGIADFYKSTDGGSSFEIRPDGWFSVPTNDAGLIESRGGRIAVTLDNPERVYVLLVGSSQAAAQLQLRGTIGVYSSDNGGEAWTFPHNLIGMPYDQETHPNLMDFDGQSSDYNQIYYNTAFACSQLDENRLLIGGLNLWRSDDGGTSYQPVGGYLGDLPLMHVDLQEFKVFKTDDTTEEFWFSSDGGLNVSNDWAQSHEARTNGIGAVNFWGIDQGWNNDIIVGGRYHNGNAASNDAYGDGNFLSLGGGEAPTGYVNYSPEQKAYFSDIDGRNLPEEIDGITTGFSMNLDPNESYYENASSRIMFDPYYWNVAYAGKDNAIYKSLDGGATFGLFYEFNVNPTDKVLWMEQCPSNPNIFYVQVLVGNTSRLYRSTNAGQSFTQLNLPQNRRELYFTVSHENASELWIAYTAGTNGNKVYRSTSGGDTWENITTSDLNGMAIKSIAHQAGTDGGVYVASRRGPVQYRDNTSISWVTVGTDVPAASFPLRLMPFYKKGKLRLGMWNLGVWEHDLEAESDIIAGFSANYRKYNCPGDTVWFTDHSVSPEGAELQWFFPGATPATSNAQSPKVVYTETGSFDVTLIVSYNNQSDTLTRSVFIESQEPGSYPLQEDFADGSFAEGWRLIDDGNNGENWIVADLASASTSDNHSMLFDNYYIDVQGRRDIASTANYEELTEGTDLTLFFDVAYARYAVNYSDTLAVYISEDCGFTKQRIYLKGGTELATAPDFSADRWVPQSSEWRQETISDLPLSYQGNVSIYFENRGYYGQPIYIDNIRLESSAGITAQQELPSPRVYPVPAGDEITVYWASLKKQARFKLSDASGRIVLQGAITEESTTVGLPSIASGLYILELRSGDDVFFEKIMKR
jgi:photosystem II stability/assembly factor-like uncharacterized protein/PKD repeat protein